MKTNLAAADTSFALNNGWGFKGNFRVYGSTYASLSKTGTLLGDPSVDPDGVWCEGTAHVAAALLTRRLPERKDIPSFHGDVHTAGLLFEGVQVVQASLGHGQTVNGHALVDERELWLRQARSTRASALTFSQYGTLERHRGTRWLHRPQIHFRSDYGHQGHESEKTA